MNGSADRSVEGYGYRHLEEDARSQNFEIERREDDDNAVSGDHYRPLEEDTVSQNVDSADREGGVDFRVKGTKLSDILPIILMALGLLLGVGALLQATVANFIDVLLAGNQVVETLPAVTEMMSETTFEQDVSSLVENGETVEVFIDGGLYDPETQTLTVNDSSEAIFNLGDASFAFPEGQYVLPEGTGVFQKYDLDVFVDFNDIPFAEGTDTSPLKVPVSYYSQEMILEEDVIVANEGNGVALTVTFPHDVYEIREFQGVQTFVPGNDFLIGRPNYGVWKYELSIAEESALPEQDVQLLASADSELMFTSLSDEPSSALLIGQKPFYILQMNTETGQEEWVGSTLQDSGQYGIELSYDFPEVDFSGIRFEGEAVSIYDEGWVHEPLNIDVSERFVFDEEEFQYVAQVSSQHNLHYPLDGANFDSGSVSLDVVFDTGFSESLSRYEVFSFIQNTGTEDNPVYEEIGYLEIVEEGINFHYGETTQSWNLSESESFNEGMGLDWANGDSWKIGLDWGQPGPAGESELRLSINGYNVIQTASDGFTVPDNTQLAIGHNHLTDTQPPFQVRALTIKDASGESFVDTNFSEPRRRVGFNNIAIDDTLGVLNYREIGIGDPSFITLLRYDFGFDSDVVEVEIVNGATELAQRNDFETRFEIQSLVDNGDGTYEVEVKIQAETSLEGGVRVHSYGLSDPSDLDHYFLTVVVPEEYVHDGVVTFPKLEVYVSGTFSDVEYSFSDSLSDQSITKPFLQSSLGHDSASWVYNDDAEVFVRSHYQFNDLEGVTQDDGVVRTTFQLDSVETDTDILTLHRMTGETEEALVFRMEDGELIVIDSENGEEMMTSFTGQSVSGEPYDPSFAIVPGEDNVLEVSWDDEEVFLTLNDETAVLSQVETGLPYNPWSDVGSDESSAWSAEFVADSEGIPYVRSFGSHSGMLTAEEEASFVAQIEEREPILRYSQDLISVRLNPSIDSIDVSEEQVILPSKVTVEGPIVDRTDMGRAWVHLEKDGEISFTDGEVAISITEDDKIVNLPSDNVETTEMTRIVTPEREMIEDEPLGWNSWQYIVLQTTAGIESLTGGALFLWGTFRFVKNTKGKQRVFASMVSIAGIVGLAVMAMVVLGVSGGIGSLLEPLWEAVLLAILPVTVPLVATGLILVIFLSFVYFLPSRKRAVPLDDVVLFNDEVYGMNDGIYELEGIQEEEEGDGALREESFNDVEPSFVRHHDDDTISVEIHMEANAGGGEVLNNASFQISEGASVDLFDSYLSEEYAEAIDSASSAGQPRRRNFMNEHRIVKGDEDVYGDDGASFAFVYFLPLRKSTMLLNDDVYGMNDGIYESEGRQEEEDGGEGASASDHTEEEETRFFPLARATLVLGAYDVRPQGRDEQGDDDSLSVTYTRKVVVEQDKRSLAEKKAELESIAVKWIDILYGSYGLNREELQVAVSLKEGVLNSKGEPVFAGNTFTEQVSTFGIEIEVDRYLNEVAFLGDMTAEKLWVVKEVLILNELQQALTGIRQKKIKEGTLVLETLEGSLNEKEIEHYPLVSAVRILASGLTNYRDGVVYILDECLYPMMMAGGEYYYQEGTRKERAKDAEMKAKNFLKSQVLSLPALGRQMSPETLGDIKRMLASLPGNEATEVTDSVEHTFWMLSAA